MMRPIIVFMLFYFSSYSMSVGELELWINEVETYQQIDLFYDAAAEPYRSAYYTTKTPSEEFKQYCRFVAGEKKQLEPLLLERYHNGATPSAIKLYVALGEPSLDFLCTFWEKAPKRSANFERSVVNISLLFHRELLHPYLETLFSKYPQSQQEFSFRYGITHTMVSQGLDSAAVQYAMQTEPNLLHDVKDSIILPILLNAIPATKNSAHRSALLRALVKQLEIYPHYYELVANSPLANPQDVEEILRYGFEYYKRRGLSDAVVKLSLNFGDSVHLYKADSLFIHLCRKYNPAELTERERAQLEVLYRNGTGYGIGNYHYKPEVLQAWQEWLATVAPDSPKMKMKLLKHMRGLKLPASTIYNHLKSSELMSENEVLIDTLLYGKSDAAFLNAVLQSAHLLSDTLYYRMFNSTTSKRSIDSCGEQIIEALATLSPKSKISNLQFIKKVGAHKERWHSTIQERFQIAAEEREKVPLNRFLYYYYLFSCSDMGEEELLQLLQLFRKIPQTEENAYCSEGLYFTFIDALDEKHDKVELSRFYESVLSRCHKKVASRKDLKELIGKIRNYEPFIFSW